MKIAPTPVSTFRFDGQITIHISAFSLPNAETET